MTQAQPFLCDDVRADFDVVEVKRFYLVVRHRAAGTEHSLSYDNILIGSNEEAEFYTITMPAWLAAMEGIDAR